MSDSQVAIVQPPAFLAVAGLTGLDAKYLVETVKKQCFKGAATDEQVDAFISIACEMKVNPLLPGMLYAYPISGGGIVPIMGPSGVYKKLVEHPEVDSWETEVFPADVTVPPTHAVTKIYRKGRDKPLQYTALLSEWKIASNPNWNSRPRHMLALRSLKHCANQIIHGIPYDEDDRVIMGMQNVTGTAPEGGTPVTAEGTVIEQQRPAPKERAKRGAAAAKEVVIEKEAAPVEDIQQAMKDREAKNQSQGGDSNATANAPGRAVEVTPPVPSNPAPAATPEPRAFLKDGEKLEAVIKLESLQPTFMTVEGKRCAGFKGVASGGFNGDVRCAIGGTATGPQNDKGLQTTMTINAPFEVGKPLNAVLHGKKSTAPAGTPLHGLTLVWIESATAVQAEEVA